MEFSLPKGTYTLSQSGIKRGETLYLVNKAGSTNIAYMGFSSFPQTITIEADIECWFSVTTSVGVDSETDVNVQIEKGNAATEFVKPSATTFVDAYARKEIAKLTDTSHPFSKIDCIPTYATMFRKIVHIGDSLTRGQYDTTSPNTTGADIPEYSRPVYMGRMLGNENVNLGIGGATASQANPYNWIDVGKGNTIFQWSEFENPGDCYIIALGTNDVIKFGSFTGNASTDIDVTNYENNANTSVGCYAKIIQMIKQMQPKAKIFCVTIPKTRNTQADRDIANPKIKAIAERFGCYVIDLEKYAEDSGTGEFAQKFKNSSHNNALGYNLRARQYIAYIDWIIENNLDDFRNVAFIGSDYDFVK